MDWKYSCEKRIVEFTLEPSLEPINVVEGTGVVTSLLNK